MQENSHISSIFEEDLTSLTRMTLELGQLAAERLDQILRALADLHSVDLQALVESDGQLDALEAAIHEKGFEVIALRGPQADDLRRVLVTLKNASALERIGDHIRNTANRMLAVGEIDTNLLPVEQLGRMGSKVADMLAEAMTALENQDSSAALSLRNQDVEVDAWHTVIYREMITAMSEQDDMLAACVHYLFIAKNIERIGDHITGIAEQIYFLDTGQMPDDERPKADKSSQLADFD